MPELTVEQRDALLAQNAANIKRQADAAEAFLAAFNAQAAELPTRGQEHFHNLVALCMTAATRTLTTASTDDTRNAAATNAVEMALAAWPLYKQGIDAA